MEKILDRLRRWKSSKRNKSKKKTEDQISFETQNKAQDSPAQDSLPAFKEDEIFEEVKEVETFSEIPTFENVNNSKNLNLISPVYTLAIDRSIRDNLQVFIFILPNILSSIDELENILIYLSSFKTSLGRDVTRDCKQIQRIKKHFMFWYATFNGINERLFKN